MKPSFYLFSLLALLVFMTGCTENMLSPDAPADNEATVEAVFDGETPTVLRNAQLLPAARSKTGDVAWGKGGQSGNTPGSDSGNTGNEGEIIQPDLFALIGYSGFQPDGITPRVLDAYAVTRRVLEEYGVTRRVLEDYGVTRRVLEEYGVTRRVLMEYGITRRVLEDYGISRRLLDAYNMTMDDFEAALVAYDPAIKVRTASDGAISVWIRGKNVTSILLEMGDDPEISFVEPDPEATIEGLGSTTMRNNKDAQFVPWGIDDIGARLVNFRGQDTHIYVLDSGVLNYDLRLSTRKDFTMLFLNREQMVHEDTEWTDPGYFDPEMAGNPEDENGHGTHVAGTLSAMDNNFGVVGAAPGLWLHSLKVLTADGRTDVTTLVAAVNYVIHQKAQVHRATDRVLINLSLGMDIGTRAYNVLDEAVQKAVADGIVVVVAAGNDGADVSTYSPAHVLEAITVGATDHQGRFAKFSNHGTGVDILAPGKDVVSLPRTRADIDRKYRVVQSGTSMSAPHVTAAAAMYWGLNPNATPAEVEAGLKAHARGGITDAPAGTTDKTVSVLFAIDLSNERPFVFDEAEWEGKNSTLTLGGDGARMAAVNFYSEASGTHLGSGTVEVASGGMEGKFMVDIRNPVVIPCSVRAEINGEVKTLAVVDAPADCDGATASTSTTSIHIDKANWQARQKVFTIEGSGPKSATYEIRTAGGEFYATTTSDAMGEWKIMDRKPNWYPCEVVVSAAGQSASMQVSNAAIGECR